MIFAVLKYMLKSNLKDYAQVNKALVNKTTIIPYVLLEVITATKICAKGCCNIALWSCQNHPQFMQNLPAASGVAGRKSIVKMF